MFTESQMAVVKAAVEFLADNQRSAHAHVAADVQEILDLFNPVFDEEPAPVAEAVAEAVAETPEAPKEAEDE